MIYAEYNNKGNNINLKNSEDIMTSNIFFLFEMLKNEVLLKVLSEAKNIEDKNINFDFNKEISNYQLWKRNENQKEPEVYFEFDKNIYLIEVKFLSEESSNNQLQSYLDEFEPKALIYLTMSNSKAKDTIKKYNNPKIYWLTWEKVNQVLNDYLFSSTRLNETEIKIIKQMIKYLDFRGCKIWKGWDNTMNLKSDVFQKFIKGNKEINELFQIMETNFINEAGKFGYEKISKDKYYYDYFYSTNQEHTDYVLNCYIKNTDKKIVMGFSFYIFLSNSFIEGKENQEDYELISDKLGFEKTFPMLLIYGSYKPINIKESNPTDWCDGILKLDDGWVDFDINNMEYNKEIKVNIKFEKNAIDDWYESANIKICKLESIDSSDKINNIIEDILSIGNKK